MSYNSGKVGVWWQHHNEDYTQSKVLFTSRPLKNAKSRMHYIMYDPRYGDDAMIAKPMDRDYFQDLDPENRMSLIVHIGQGIVVFNQIERIYEIRCNTCVCKNKDVQKMVIDKFNLEDTDYIFVDEEDRLNNFLIPYLSLH